MGRPKANLPKVKVERDEKSASLILDDGSIIDLDKVEDWGNKRISRRVKEFIFWFCYPYNNDCYHDPKKAALKAGYAKKVAAQNAYWLRQSHKDIIANFENKFIKITIEDALKKVLTAKLERINFDFMDFYEVTEGVDGNQRITMKMPDEIPEDKRRVIDGIDYKGMQGIPNYILPDKNKELDTLIKLIDRLEGHNQNENKQQDVNIFLNVIKDKADNAQKVIAIHDKEALEAGDFIVYPEELLEED